LSPSSPISFKKEVDINKQFTFLNTIGKGAYGNVFLVEQANDIAVPKKVFAIKVLQFMDNYKTKAEKDEHIKNLTWEL